ncbi:hypothetical protein [Dendronalium sp. ChiSLP03b]|uniref:hypothetical protein n=1 Tax=Dendronalium sp. ChiSLP03b TaxID=3075381 RepID=UPI002AD47B2A|nr:hypothetical protein [Dendronalium sp. ChiSLP03b]MDZ8205186.1 hypothetical protein [Dendronalium sp. ChiSLP03b]
MSQDSVAVVTQPDTVEPQPGKGKKYKKTKKSKQSDGDRSISKTLFEAYRDTEEIVTRCAISYLLKNGCKINNKDEDGVESVHQLLSRMMRSQVSTPLPAKRQLLLCKVSKFRGGLKGISSSQFLFLYRLDQSLG